MAVTVNYGNTWSDYNDSSLTFNWSNLDGFFNVYDEHFDVASHSDNPGAFAGTEDPNPLVSTGFWGSLFGPFSGTQYVLEGENPDLDLGFIVEAADGEYLNYTFFSGPSHTMYGEIESITFGSGLTQGADGEYYFTEELVSFEGLDTIGLNGGIDENGNVIDRNSGNNHTHNLINSLKDGDPSVLEALLAEQGVDLTEVITTGTAAATEAELLAA